MEPGWSPHQASPLIPDPSASGAESLFCISEPFLTDDPELPRRQNDDSGNYALAKGLDEGNELVSWI